MIKEIKNKSFSNGAVYLYETEDGYPLEVTDTFLPYYTKDAIGRKQNLLSNTDLGSRAERWMVGVSCMSGCPVKCKFCATSKLKRWRNLTVQEIEDQFFQIVFAKNNRLPVKLWYDSQEFKINYTRMGEPFLNIENIKTFINSLGNLNCGYRIHHYISTIGIKGSNFSWIKDNITLQISLHSLDEKKRDWLIPYKNKMTIEELGQIRTNSNQKTTINLTLIDESDFDIEKLKKYFDPKYFFIKLSPINKNEISEKNGCGDGIIKAVNIV